MNNIKPGRSAPAPSNISFLTATVGVRLQEDALVRIVDKAKERYMEVDNDAPWRPDLRQKISEYHLGLSSQTEESCVAAAERVLSEARDSSPERALAAAAEALGLRLEYGELEPLAVVQLAPTSPGLAFAGDQRADAARAALRYMRTALALARSHAHTHARTLAHTPAHSPAHIPAHSPAHSPTHTPARTPRSPLSANVSSPDCF